MPSPRSSDTIYTDPAQTSGTAFQSPGSGDHGMVLPPIATMPLPTVAPPGMAGVSLRRGSAIQTSSPPATLSSIEAHTPDSSIPLAIDKPLALTPSVAGTVFNATPLNNIASILRDFPSAAGRPILPVGARQWVIDKLPSGLRDRAAIAGRTVARVRAARPSSGNHFTRE